MKKQSKAKKPQLNLRIEPEFHTRLAELGEKVGLTANQFVIEAMRRYGEVLADVMFEDNQEQEELSRRQRERLKAKIHSSRR